MRRHAWSGAAFGAALSLITVACGEKSVSEPIAAGTTGSPSAQIALLRRFDTLSVDQSMQLTAIVPALPGSVAPSVRWQSSDTNVAVVTRNGVLFALKSGRATVTASMEGTSDATSVTVHPGIRDISFEADSIAISLAQSVKVPYRVTDTDGNAVDLSKHSVEWVSTAPDVMPLTGDATVTGRAIGRAELLLRVDTKVGSTHVRVMAKPVASVHVSPTSLSLSAGQNAQLVTAVLDVDGTALTGRSINYGSSNTAIATVDSKGLVTGVKAGSTTIDVNAEGRKASVAVTVSGSASTTLTPPVATVSVALGSSSLAADKSTKATAVLKDAGGNTLSGRDVLWTSDDPAVATVDSAGVVSAVGPGSTKIMATAEGKSGNATLSVVASQTIGSVSVSVASSINVGKTAQATATVKDASGQVVTGRSVSWVSSDASIASVSSSGLVTALKGGSVTITASVDGKTGSAVVTSVAPVAAVRSIKLAAPATNLRIGEVLQISAVVEDANGNPLTSVPVTWSSSRPSVATVSSGGVVAGIGAGSATISAKADTVTRTLAFTVVDTASTTGASSPTGSVYGNATPAELPRLTVNTAYPSVSRQVSVPAGASLQAAINAALPGDELLLAPGASYVGNFTLPPKSGSGWIVIRTNVSDAALGAAGTRMTPSRAGSLKLAKIQSPNLTSVITTDLGAHNYRFTGVDIGSTLATGDINALIRFGDGSSAQNTAASVAYNLIIDRSWVHGSPLLDLRRCVMLNSATSAVVDSWLGDCHSSSGDSQSIIGWNGPGPYLIQNNHLEAGHEVVAFGGSSSFITNQSPSDITLRRNHITRPTTWKGVWSAKNLIETKHARRLLIEGNVIEDNWMDAQAGFAFVLKSENQNGDTPWTQSTDITIRYNKIRNTGNVFNLAANPSGIPAVPAGRMVITDNVIENVNTSPYLGDGHTLQLLGGLYDIVMMHNTVLSANGGSATTVVFGALPVIQRLVIHSNVFHHGVYGMKGGGTTEGSISLGTFAPGYLVTNNVISNGGTPGNYPAYNYFPSTQSGIGFVDLAGGDFHLSGSSPYKNDGYDGRDVGADIDKVNALTPGVTVAP
jgi:uncharacterized protein YjdB